MLTSPDSSVMNSGVHCIYRVSVLMLCLCSRSCHPPATLSSTISRTWCPPASRFLSSAPPAGGPSFPEWENGKITQITRSCRRTGEETRHNATGQWGALTFERLKQNVEIVWLWNTKTRTPFQHSAINTDDAQHTGVKIY